MHTCVYMCIKRACMLAAPHVRATDATFTLSLLTLMIWHRYCICLQSRDLINVQPLRLITHGQRQTKHEAPAINKSYA